MTSGLSEMEVNAPSPSNEIIAVDSTDESSMDESSTDSNLYISSASDPNYEMSEDSIIY